MRISNKLISILLYLYCYSLEAKEDSIIYKARMLSPKYKSNCLKEKLLEKALNHVMIKGGVHSNKLVEIKSRNAKLVEELSKHPLNNTWDMHVKIEQEKKLLYSDNEVVSLANKLFTSELRKFNLASKSRYANSKRRDSDVIKRANASLIVDSKKRKHRNLNRTIISRRVSNTDESFQQSGFIRHNLLLYRFCMSLFSLGMGKIKAQQIIN